MALKVFGIISYFPDTDSDYHKMVRRIREHRCSDLLRQINELWSDVDIIIIAQNWQEYAAPKISNNVDIRHFHKLGILPARKLLREIFLSSKYDHLIMLDDDITFQCQYPNKFMTALDNYAGGFSVVIPNMRFMTISKAIYSAVDLPEIDPEFGEGFGDKVFIDSCMTKYHEYNFDLSSYIKVITPTYLDQVPSTWVAEHDYDKMYMGVVTEQTMKLNKHESIVIPDNDSEIDVVLPYVDLSDETWLHDFQSTAGSSGISSSRFRTWGTLKYLLRGIEKYMPFVRNIVFIVSQESQVPEWLDTSKLRIVYHRDFIPESCLPTFNSCTIESFLYNIPDLSDRFIYFNDDIFPINDMVIGDFFTGNTPHILFADNQPYNRSYVFFRHCRNSQDLITDLLGLDRYDVDKIVISEHSVFPMIKSTLDIIRKSCNDIILKSATPFRRSCNYNQYIYHYYQYYTGNYISDICPYMYQEVDDDIENLRNILFNSKFRLLCLNDLGADNYDEIREKLLRIFNEKFPDKCKYEV